MKLGRVFSVPRTLVVVTALTALMAGSPSIGAADPYDYIVDSSVGEQLFCPADLDDAVSFDLPYSPPKISQIACENMCTQSGYATALCRALCRKVAGCGCNAMSQMCDKLIAAIPSGGQTTKTMAEACVAIHLALCNGS